MGGKRAVLMGEESIRVLDGMYVGFSWGNRWGGDSGYW